MDVIAERHLELRADSSSIDVVVKVGPDTTSCFSSRIRS
jgi:hypothetical protein